MKEKEKIKALIENLKDINPIKRKTSQIALMNMDRNVILEPLLYSMLESNPRLFQSSEEIIFSMKGEIEDLLIKNINHKNKLIGALTIELLGKLKYKKNVEIIKNISETEKSLVLKKAADDFLKKLK